MFKKDNNAGLYMTIAVHLVLLIVLLSSRIGYLIQEESSFVLDFTKEEEIEIRQVKYLNNIIEQDHRFIKKRTRPTLGFKNFYSARETISGIENIRMIQKGQILGQSACQSSFNNFANLMA